jgi:hypothetical protein
MQVPVTAPAALLNAVSFFLTVPFESYSCLNALVGCILKNFNCMSKYSHNKIKTAPIDYEN